MKRKIIGFVKKNLYILKYGNTLHVQGIPDMDLSSGFKLENGTARIGRCFSMKPGAYAAIVRGGVLTIGDRVSINRNSILVCHDHITIGDRTSIAPNVLIYDHDHRFGQKGLENGYRTAPVTIGSDCWIGAGVIILRGSTIGDGCVIGAGSIVRGDIPPHSLVTSDRTLHITPIGDRNQ